MRISDWSSDVCSSDLSRCALALRVRMLFGRLKSKASMAAFLVLGGLALAPQLASAAAGGWAEEEQARLRDRKSVVEGKSVSVRVDLGGRRIIKKNKPKHRNPIAST